MGERGPYSQAVGGVLVQLDDGYYYGKLWPCSFYEVVEIIDGMVYRIGNDWPVLVQDFYKLVPADFEVPLI